MLSVKKAQEPWLTSTAVKPEGIAVDYAIELPFPRLLEFLQGCCSRLLRPLGLTLKRNYFRYFLAVPDSQIFWLFQWKGYQLAKISDVIYVSCGPNSAAVGAAIISWLVRKPLVVDFRDAWGLNPYGKPEGIPGAISRGLEGFVLKRSSAIILNTPGAERLYRKKFPEISNKMCCIPNGFDSFPQIKPARTEQFTIVHLGTFYTSRRPDLLLEAVRQLPELNIRFIQVGGSFDSASKFADMPNVTILESVSRTEITQYYEQASLLYLKQGWEHGVTDYISVAAKTYEYILSGVPILIEAPPGDNLDLVTKYAARSYVVSNENDLEGMKNALIRAYAEWKAERNSSAQIANQVSEEFLRKFDRRKLTGDLAAILDRCLEPTALPRSQ